MTTKEHIAVRRRKQTIASLEQRIVLMNEIIKAGIIPEGFEYHKSDKRLMEWVDPDRGITKVGINTARDNYPLLWNDIQNCRSNLKKLEKAKTTAKNKQKSKTKNAIQTAKQQAEKEVKRLTNELVMLRIAYRDLLASVNDDKHKSRILQEAIKRHNSHFGLQNIIREAKQDTQ